MIQNCKTEASLKEATNQGGSHYYCQEEIKKLITNSSDRRKLNDKISNLKDFRVKSDYHNIKVEKKDAEKSIDLSLEIKNLLKGIFKL